VLQQNGESLRVDGVRNSGAVLYPIQTATLVSPGNMVIPVT